MGYIVSKLENTLYQSEAQFENVEKYILACLTLHNYLRQTKNTSYLPLGLINSGGSSGNILSGTWESENEVELSGALANIKPVGGGR